jgi:hypothetical protein
MPENSSFWVREPKINQLGFLPKELAPNFEKPTYGEFALWAVPFIGSEIACHSTATDCNFVEASRPNCFSSYRLVLLVAVSFLF